MRDNALYFPYISVPDEAWTMKALLYWDKFSSIVPGDYLHHPEGLEPFMRDLVQEGLVEQIVPGWYVGQVAQFNQSFIAMLDAREARLEKLRVKRSLVKPRTRIHIEKLGDIPYYLVDRGLAMQKEYPWFEVDADIAKLFMAYLAACLGAIPEVNAAPVTNKTIFASAFGAPVQAYKRHDGLHHRKAREVILHSLLPVPSGKLELGDVIRFKAEHGHLLPALRRKVEAASASIAAIKDPEDRLTATEDFIAQSRQEVAEIVEAMKPTWAKITMGSLCPLFGNGLALQATDIANKVAFAGSALSFAGAAYQAIASIGTSPQMMRRPLAYVAHARARFNN